MGSLIAHGWDEPTRYPEPMGLDAVDIVLRCEETFDLHLEDKDIGEIATVGQLFEHLCTKLQLRNGTAAPEHPGTDHLRARLALKIANPAQNTGPAKTSGPPS